MQLNNIQAKHTYCNSWYDAIKLGGALAFAAARFRCGAAGRVRSVPPRREGCPLIADSELSLTALDEEEINRVILSESSQGATRGRRCVPSVSLSHDVKELDKGL